MEPATDGAYASGDIAVVQRLAGHASIHTTARYDGRDDEVKENAARLLLVPSQRSARN